MSVCVVKCIITAVLLPLQSKQERARFECPLCGTQVYRITLHLQQKHKLTCDSDEYRRLLCTTKRVDPDARTTDTATLDGVMDAFKRFLRSMAGGDKSEEVARGTVRDVRRVIEDILNGESYRPRLLYRLKDIGDVPDGVLYKYKNGQLRDRKCLKSTTLNVWLAALIHFVKFIKREPIHVRGTLSSDQLHQVLIGLEGCLKSTSRHRLEEDAAKRISAIGTYCSPEIVGRFLECTAVQEAWQELDACARDPSRRTCGAFAVIRNSLMLSAGLTNARRTGDLCNMTLQEFASHRPSRANPKDNIVHVRRHKTALGGKPCKVNFYDRLFARTQRYVDVFGGQFLETAAPTGLLFPHLSHGGHPCRMSTSQYDKILKRLWGKFAAADNDQDIPPASSVSSTYFRHVFVSLVHGTCSRQDMEETAAHMSHNLRTAEVHYEALGAVELTSRACQIFRRALCHANPGLAAATGVLESDKDDRHDDDGSSPDVSSDADSLSDVEPDDPVYAPSGGVHTVTAAPSTSTQRSTCDVPVTVDRHRTTEQGDVREDEPAAKRRRLAESTSTTSSVAGPIPGGSSTASRTSQRGNKCMPDRDVELLAAATKDYRSVTLRSYGCVQAGRIMSLLRQAGGDFAEMANKYDLLANGGRCLANRVRLMLLTDRKRLGLPLTKARAKQPKTEPPGPVEADPDSDHPG